MEKFRLCHYLDGIFRRNVMNEKVRIRILRLLLLFSAFGWGITFVGLVLPWELIINILTGLQLIGITEVAISSYWFKMTAGTYSFIGLIFLLLALNPQKYETLITVAGLFMLAEALISLTSGIFFKLPFSSFCFDFIFCSFAGLGITILNNISRKK
ncbi:MAG: hypothetical protein A2017_15150 [Lentisphaerae bacterium GWF2_44_16]|nr:MAG: hypothetical protein A2017_15150 [Lentisphaerae bacterium GWF2_44_16]